MTNNKKNINDTLTSWELLSINEHTDLKAFIIYEYDFIIYDFNQSLDGLGFI